MRSSPAPWREITGSETPNSSMRLRMVCWACLTACSRMALSSSGRRVKTSALRRWRSNDQRGQVGVDHLVDRGAALGGDADRLELAVLERGAP